MGRANARPMGVPTTLHESGIALVGTAQVRLCPPYTLPLSRFDELEGILQTHPKQQGFLLLNCG
jgi:hypothetical protein